MFIKSCLLTVLFAYTWACRVPPQFWCDTEEIAKECQVLDQCQKYLKFNSSQAAPVELTLYYESLCPDCQAFFRNQLTPTYSKLSAIVNLQLVPYGNAQESQNGSEWIFECQHGKQECIGNLIETCILALTKNDMSKAFPFISCMEASDDLPSQAATKCAGKLDVDVDPIMQCAGSSVGNMLEHKMAVKTESLNPPHTYVPWITLNGVHTDAVQKQAENDLLKLICDTYKGKKPGVCASTQQVSLRTNFNNIF